jgi:hypothetical protein
VPVEDDLLGRNESRPLIQPDEVGAAEQCDHRDVKVRYQSLDHSGRDAAPPSVRMDHHVVDVCMKATVGDRSSEANERRGRPRAHRTRSRCQYRREVLFGSLWPPADLVECQHLAGCDLPIPMGGLTKSRDRT